MSVRGETAGGNRLALYVLLGVAILGCGGVAIAGFGILTWLAADFTDSGGFRSDDPDLDDDDAERHVAIVLGADLPNDATNVHYAYDAGIDHIGALRADLRRDQFDALMTEIGLSPWSPTRTFSDDDMWLTFAAPPPEPAWWTPPMEIDETVYVAQHGSVWRMARYDGTTLWYSTLSH